MLQALFFHNPYYSVLPFKYLPKILYELKSDQIMSRWEVYFSESFLLIIILLFACVLFVCLVCLKPHEQFFSYLAAVTIISDRAVNFGLWSALRAFQKGEIFTVPNLLQNGTSVYTVSSERPVPTPHSGILTPDARIIRRISLPKNGYSFPNNFFFHFQRKFVFISEDLLVFIFEYLLAIKHYIIITLHDTVIPLPLAR
jgi:hypothetical protein